MTYFIDYENKHSIFICVCPFCMQTDKQYFSQERLMIKNCKQCEKGKLFLAKSKTKKEYFFVCSCCPFKILVLENAENAEIEKNEKKCKNCSAKTLHAKIKKSDGSKLDLTEFCVFCSESKPNEVVDLTDWRLKMKKFGTRGKKKHVKTRKD